MCSLYVVNVINVILKSEHQVSMTFFQWQNNDFFYIFIKINIKDPVYNFPGL